MSSDRKNWLLENIVRLRRAEREAPESREVAAVRAALEKELGTTVSRRAAASLLGVSHTALARWVRSGDIPTVPGRTGRTELPLDAVLDLYEAVAGQPESARRGHPLEPIMNTARERATTIRLEAQPTPDGDRHRLAEVRSLAYHQVLARRLRRPMIDDARHLLWRWRDQGSIDARYADQWETILRMPVADIRREMIADTAGGRDLRQNSPFAGMLSEAERREIYKRTG